MVKKLSRFKSIVYGSFAGLGAMGCRVNIPPPMPVNAVYIEQDLPEPPPLDKLTGSTQDTLYKTIVEDLAKPVTNDNSMLTRVKNVLMHTEHIDPKYTNAKIYQLAGDAAEAEDSVSLWKLPFMGKDDLYNLVFSQLQPRFAKHLSAPSAKALAAYCADVALMDLGKDKYPRHTYELIGNLDERNGYLDSPEMREDLNNKTPATKPTTKGASR